MLESKLQNAPERESVTSKFTAFFLCRWR